jgi:hypothetical protein
LYVAGGIGGNNGFNINGNGYLNGNLNVTGYVTATNITLNTLIANSGTFYGDAAGNGALYAGILGGTIFPQTVIQATGNFNNYSEFNIQNINAGTKASTDIVASADNVTISSAYIDMGIASSTFDGSQLYSLGQTVGPNDGYLMVGQNAAVGLGDLVFGTTTAGTQMRFVIAATATTVTNASIAIVMNQVNTTATSTATGTLIVNGGAGVAGNLYAGGNMFANGAAVWTTATLTNLNQLSNGPGYITSATLGLYGVSAINAGTGISVSSNTGSVTVTNIGVVSLIGTTYLGISGASGSGITLTNLGVQQTIAGAGITVSSNTGSVTISSTDTLLSVTNRGSITSNAIQITNATAGSTNTGALQVTGGVSVGGALYAGSLFSNNAAVWTTATLTNLNQLSNGPGYLTSATVGSYGVASIQAGTGISVSGSTGSVTVTNIGVVSLVGSTYLGISAASGSNITLTNLGVQQAVAGSGISVSGSTGSVTISSTETLLSVTNRGSITSNAINITNTNSSTSTTTGALTVAGGVGIGGAVNIGQTSTIAGANIWTTATLTNNNQLANGAGYITSATLGVYGVSAISAGTDTAVSASTGSVTIWNTSTLQSITNRSATTTNVVYFANGTQASSPTTGALIVAGGLGISGNIYSGGPNSVFGDLASSSTFNVNATRSLNLIGTASVMRIARSSTTGDPAVELINLNTQTGAITTWWDFYSNTGANNFAIRNRGTGATADLYANFGPSGTIFGVVPVTISTWTNATSTTTGALVVSGGAGIGGNLYATAMFSGNAAVWTTATLTNLGQLSNTPGYLTSATLGVYGVSSILSGTDTAVSTATGAVTVWDISTLQSVTGRGATTTNIIYITNGTAATSTSSGALQVTGGVGIGGGMFIGGSTKGVNLNTGTYIGANIVGAFTQSQLRLTYPAAGDWDHLVNSGGSYTISGAGTLNLGAPTIVAGNAVGGNIFRFAGIAGGTTNITTDVQTGVMNVFTGMTTGAINMGGAGGGKLVIAFTTTAVSTQTGALQVRGGAGISGDLYVNGIANVGGALVWTTATLTNNNQLTNGANYLTSATIGLYGVSSIQAGSGISVSANTGSVTVSSTDTLLSVTNRGAITSNAVQITNTSQSASTNSGQALLVTGGVGIGGSLYVGSSLNVIGNTYLTGDLYIDGTQTYVNATNIQTGDKVLYLSTGAGSAALAVNSGIAIGTTATPYISWWFDGVGNWISSGGIISNNTLTVLSTVAATSTATGALQVQGGVGVGGSVYASALYDNNARVWTTATLTNNNQLTNGSGYLTSATIGIYGVSAINAGTDTAVSASTGSVTIWDISTLQSVTGRGATTTNAVNIANTLQSTSTNTGALTVAGGIGLGGNITLNQSITFVSTGSGQGLQLPGAVTTSSGSINTAVTTGSVIFSAGNRIQFPTTSALQFNSSDFTVEFWMNATASQVTYAVITDASTNNTATEIGVGVNDSGTAGKIGFQAAPGYEINGATTVLDGTWRHIACVKRGNTGTIYVNGVQDATTSAWGAVSAAYLSRGTLGGSSYGSGTAGDNYFTGSISNFRISNIARYATNFTPPTSVFVNDANTVLLLPFYSSPTILTDLSSNNFALAIASGNSLPTWSSAAPALSTATSTVSGGIISTTTMLSWTYDGTANWVSSQGIKALSVVAATSTNTGALQVAGGAGIGGNVFAGGTINAASNIFAGGTIVTTSAVGSSSTGTGALIVSGGAGIGGNLYATAMFSGNAAVWTTATLTNLGQLSNTPGYLTSATLSTFGVSAVFGTPYLGVSSAVGAVTLTNLGVQSFTAGSGISTTAATGTITVSSTDTLLSVTNRGSITSNIIQLTNTVNATNTQSGALQVTGGVGIQGSVYAGPMFSNNAAVWTTATLTGVGQLSNTAGYITSATIGQYGVASIQAGLGISVSASTGSVTVTNIGVISLAGTQYIGISSPTGSSIALTNLGVQTAVAGADIAVSTSTGTVVISGTGTFQSVTNRGAITSNAIQITNATAASSTITGALIVTGGVGIGGNIYAGNIYSNGTLLVNGSSGGSSTTATNLAVGTVNQVPYQSGTGVTTFSNNFLFNGSSLAVGGANFAAQISTFGGTGDTQGLKFQASGWPYYVRAGINGTVGSDFIISSNWNAQTNALDTSTYSSAYIDLSNSGFISFGVGASAIPSERGRFDNTGGFDIGYTSSQGGAKLSVNGGAFVNGTVTATNFILGGQQVLTTANLSSYGVTTFSGGTTGLTPTAATAGAITLAGTLGVANGGTGLTSLTANYIPYGAGTGAFAASSNLQFNGTTLTVSAATVNGTFTQGSGYAYLGNYNSNATTYPTLNVGTAFANNWSAGSAESNIWNTFNPSTYTTTGLRFMQLVTASSARDLMFLRQDGALSFGGTGNIGTAGYILQSNGAASPTWVNPTTIATPTPNALTMNNSGTGAASGTTFNGSSAITLSYNTIGASPLAGSTSLTTLGTVTAGTWNAGVITATYGGTGVAGTLTGISYMNGASAYTVASSAQILSAIGTVPASNGGTGAAGTLTGYVYANGAGAMTASTTIPASAITGTLPTANYTGNISATANTNAFEYIVGVAAAASTSSAATVSTTVPLGFNASTGLVGIGNSSPQYKLDVGPIGGAQSINAGAAGLIRNASGADASPYTQARIVVYGGTGVDVGNWGYLGYGNDASMRVVYAKTAAGAPLYFGTSSAMDGTGTFSPTLTLATNGNLTATGLVTAPTAYISTSAGVGVAAPRSKLGVVSGTDNINADVAGVVASFVGPTQTGQSSSVSIESNDAVAADTGGILGFGGRYSGTSYANWASIKGLKADATSGNYGGYLSFHTRLTGAGSVERMRIDTNGQVSISTTTAATGYSLTIGGAASAPKIAGAVTISDTPPANPTSGTLWWDSTYLALRIYYAASAVWVDALTTVNGQTPQITAGTDISSSTAGSAPPVVTINNISTLQSVTGRGAATSNAISITNSTNSSGYNNGALIVTGGAGFGGNLYTNSNAYHAGALGVGTTAPTTAGQIYATNSITAFYSDERLKTKIATIENALDKVDQLTGFIYTSNELAASFGYTDQTLQVGISAQAAQRVQPEVVKPAPFDLNSDGSSKSGENYLTVQYEKLVPLLIEAIKELRAEVNLLKGK